MNTERTTTQNFEVISISPNRMLSCELRSFIAAFPYDNIKDSEELMMSFASYMTSRITYYIDQVDWDEAFTIVKMMDTLDKP